MEQYTLLCLDCDEIFSGREHACKKTFKTPITAEVHGVNKQVTRLDGSTIESDQSSNVQDGTHDKSLLENSNEIISTTKDVISNQVRNEKENTCQNTSLQQNAAFSCSSREYSGAPSVQQQSGDSGEGLFAFECEPQKYNSSVTPIFQKDGNNHFTSQDVADFPSMIAEHSVRNAFSSTSASNTDASAGPSNGWKGTDPCETFDAEAYRREVDRYFECPFCGKISRTKFLFLEHYKTHTGEKPYSCDMCEYKCSFKSNLERHRKTHTGEKAYKCPLCQRAFKHSQNCKRHIETVHYKK